MKNITTTAEITDAEKGFVWAIGNFDGLHSGHQALIKAAQHKAQELKTGVGVLTFEPHPRQIFQPDMPPSRLTPAPIKVQRIQALGVDIVLSLNFDWAFASQSANDFVHHILQEKLSAAHIFIGENFRFGQFRQGSAATIEALGTAVTTFPAITDDKGEIISSSRIRQLLREGDVATASKLLGWQWEIQGIIVRGDRRGHDLGYPTANILLHDTLHPAYGVYACLVQIEDDTTWHKAATNIGIRPMFELKVGQVEVHILDFPDIDIYGKNILVRPIRWLRSEARFGSLDDLITQMEKDCLQAREILT